MIDLLIASPLLLLFVVSALGYLLGRIRIGGVGLGVAAVLFVGLAFGALDQRMALPEIVSQLGLVLFVYSIGLSSGPGFFASLRRKGLRDNLLVLGIILLAAALCVGLHHLLGMGAALTAGMFTGSLTNTPALASVIEQLQRGGGSALAAEPVVGYSITYPMGVLGMMLAVYVLQRWWRVDYATEASGLTGSGAEELVSRTARITQPRMDGRNIGELLRSEGWHVIFGRMRHEDRVELATIDAYLHLHDLVTVVGGEDEVGRVVAALGEAAPEPLELSRHTMDNRRIFVSNPAVVGRPLRELDLPRRQGAIITRVRRGDTEILPHEDLVLELGDRVRVVTRRDHMAEVSRYFGDSYRRLSEIDVVSLGLGIALGLVLGRIPLSLPGVGGFTLGIAGGPLVAALILGRMERSGPVIWSLPYSANLTLRQIGLTLFLAGVGIRSGHSFVTTLTQGGGLGIFLAGTLITCCSAVTMLVVGHRLLKIPLGLCIGMLAGMQTQPALLAFATEQTRNDLPNIGYATVYPMATIGKIVAAQLLLAMLG